VLCVDLYQARLFLQIAQNRSISRAAVLSGVTQSAASQQLQEMEKRAGLALVDRSTRPLTLTPAGELYCAACRDTVERWERFERDLDLLRGASEGTVRVASIYSVGLSEMTELEAEFQRRAPDARLEVDYLRPEKVYGAVERGEVDLGIVSYPEPSREIRVIPWRAEQMVVAASPYHRLAKLSVVAPAELGGEDFVGFDEELPIARHVRGFLKHHGVRVNQTFHFDNIQMIKEVVAHGIGVSIMPARIMLTELGQGRLVAIPLAEPGLYRPLGILHRRKQKFGRAAQAFLDLLLEGPEA
jgi:DNA-binding transcriptional LysR family regulator